jgi:Ras-related protein Rab-18
MKKLSVHGKAYRLNLLDTAGQERFRTLSNSYYRGAHGVILVYDISNRDSFLAMERWFEEAESNAQPGAILYLVGAKMDKNAVRMVKPEEGERMAKERGCQGFCEVSSKTRENVRKPFIEIVDAIVKKPELLNSGTRKAGIAVGGGGNEGYGSGCSC